MGLSFGSSYQFGAEQHSPCLPSFDWIAHYDTPLTIKQENFERISAIGKGKFGLVFLAQHKQTNKFVAIKYIAKQSIFDSQKLSKFQQELTVLQSVRHPFLMECFGGFDTPSCIAIVCEFAYGGELYHRLKKKVKLTEAEAKFYFCEIASAIHYLHDTLQLVYRDLKPENILIDHTGHVKICDFGFTAPCNDEENDLRDGCGTAMYIAPEVAGGFMKGTHGFPVDWWALGCVLFEMTTGEAPFGDSDSLSKFEIFNNITEKTVLYPLLMNFNLKGLLKGLLEKRPGSRFNWQQVVSSNWLQDVNWSLVESRKIRPPWIPECSSTLNHTMHFLKWDIALPKDAPSPSVTAYCHGLVLPTKKGRPNVGANASFRGEIGSGERSPVITTAKSEKMMTRKQSSRSGNLEHHDSSKMLLSSSPSMKRKKSSLVTVPDENGDGIDSIPLSSEKMKLKSSRNIQATENQQGSPSLARRSSSKAALSPSQVHPR